MRHVNVAKCICRTEQEAERRQRQIETLQSSLIHLQTQFTNVADKDMQRAELLGSGNRPSLWDDDDDDDPMADTAKSSGIDNKPYTVHDLRKQQTKIMDNQNEGLEALAKVISRQKHLALRIGDEVEEQNGRPTLTGIHSADISDLKFCIFFGFRLQKSSAILLLLWRIRTRA